MHLSRICEELVLWMNPRFGFIDIADRFCTGSSIMPQKKNPDVAELIRGKTGRINGHLVALLTLMKSQPLAYNKDNQEDKEPLFDTVDTLMMSLAVFRDMLAGVTVNKAATGFLMIVSAEHKINMHVGKRPENPLRVLQSVALRQLTLHRVVMHDDYTGVIGT